jgi:hypothetical protein
MKVVGVQGADLAKCVRQSQRERVVLTRKGKPVAVLLGVAGLDLEQVLLGQSDEFWSLIRQRRAQKTMTRAELDRRLTEPGPVAPAAMTGTGDGSLSGRSRAKRGNGGARGK